jgi:predicted esterase
MKQMTEPMERRLTIEWPCYYDLHIPESDRPKPLVIATHGYGGDKTSMMKLMRRILADREGEYAIAALQGPHQHLVMPTKESRTLGHGFGWLSNFKSEESVAIHHQLIRRLMETLRASGEADVSRVFLVGFSQSVGVNFRFAFTHPGVVRGAVAICGGIPGDWDAEGKYEPADVDVLYVAAERDEFYTPERMRQNAEALRRRARSVELQFFDAGHEVPRASYPVIRDWLLRHA